MMNALDSTFISTIFQLYKWEFCSEKKITEEFLNDPKKIPKPPGLSDQNISRTFNMCHQRSKQQQNS